MDTNTTAGREPMPSMKTIVYVGTYTALNENEPPRSEGIFVYQLDQNARRLAFVQAVESGKNPAFLALHPNERFLYSVNEDMDGQASALRIDPQTRQLEFLNRVTVKGAGPCYTSVSRSGNFLMTANYVGGSLSVMPILPDGQLEPAAFVEQHTGSGPNRERQDTAHAHCILPDPSGQWLLSADLGQDRVWVYRLDETSGRLIANDPPGLDGTPGAGPRHIAVHPSGQFIYIANELDSTVTACAWDAGAGLIRALHSLPTLPEGFRGENSVADIHLTPSGRYLYVSNRGHDSLAAFRVDPQTGRLTAAGHYPSGGRTPRNFAVSPDGGFILAANQDSDNLVLLQIDEDSGALAPAGEPLAVPKPVCVLIVEAA